MTEEGTAPHIKELVVSLWPIATRTARRIAFGIHHG